MMELILEYTDTQKAKVFNILRTNKQQNDDFTGQQMHFNFAFVNIY